MEQLLDGKIRVLVTLNSSDEKSRLTGWMATFAHLEQPFMTTL
jgi:hypothetical protein